MAPEVAAPPIRLELPAGAPVLTLETALFGLILLIAAGFRLVALGLDPLGPLEADRALGAWQLARGAAPGLWDAPLPQFVGMLSIFLLGSSDLTVRFLPAVAGIAAVAAVWLLRPLLGRVEALLAAALIATSPLLVLFSRRLGPEPYAALFGLLFVAAGFRWLASGSTRWLATAALTLGLLLATGGPAISLVLVAALFVAGLLATGRRRTVLDAWPMVASPERRRQLAAMVILPPLLAGTALLLYPGGFGLPAIGSWVRLFDPGPQGSGGIANFGWLLAYEPLALVLGLVGLVRLVQPVRDLAATHTSNHDLAWANGPADTSNRDAPFVWRGAASAGTLFASFLGVWAGLGLLLVLLAGPNGAGQGTSAVVPLALLGGQAGAELLRRVDLGLLRQEWRWPAAVLLLVVFVVLVVNHLTQPTRTVLSYQWTAVALGVALMTALVVYAWQQLGREIAPVFALAGLVVLSGYALHSAGQIVARPGPELIVGAHVSGGVRDLADQVQEVRDWRRGQAVKVWVARDIHQQFAWYLKDVPDVQFSYIPDAQATVLIAPGDVAVPKPERFSTVKMQEWKDGVEMKDLATLWRWLIHREPARATVGREIVMYVGG